MIGTIQWATGSMGSSSGHRTIDIKGRPNIWMTMDIRESDPDAAPSRALTDATMAVAIRAIPDVIAGLFACHPPAAWRRTLEQPA